jgi:hypothetical protein
MPLAMAMMRVRAEGRCDLNEGRFSVTVDCFNVDWRVQAFRGITRSHVALINPRIILPE